MRRPEQRRLVPGIGKGGCRVPGSYLRPRSWQRQTRLIGMFSSPLASCGVDAAGGSGGALRCGGGQGNGWGCRQYSTHVLFCANLALYLLTSTPKQMPLAHSPTRLAEPEAIFRFYHRFRKTSLFPMEQVICLCKQAGQGSASPRTERLANLSSWLPPDNRGFSALIRSRALLDRDATVLCTV